MVRELFEKVLQEYKSARNENFTEHPLKPTLTDEIPKFLKLNLKNPDKYKVSGSAGQGVWTYLPWIAIMNKKITKSPQKGYYIVYLFREDMKGVYLSLNQGMTEIKSQTSSKHTKEILEAKAVEYRNLLGNFDSSYIKEIDLGTDKSPNSPFYEAGNIYAKYYPIDKLPSDNELKNDFTEFLKLYDIIADESFVLKIIENSEEITEAQNDFLNQLHNEADEVISTENIKIGMSSGVEVKTYWLKNYDFWVVNRDLNLGNRYFNAFGIEYPNKNTNVQAVCEINIEKEGINKKTAGAFAKDQEGNVYLIHRGNIGGISKTIFFDKYNGESVEVQDGNSKTDVIVISNLNDPKFSEHIRDFIFAVAEIKGIKRKDLDLIKDKSENIIYTSNNSIKIWKVTPGSYEVRENLWHLFKKNGYIGIGNFGNEDFINKDYKEFNSEEEIKEFLIKNDNKTENTRTHKMIWDFTNSINIGDYVVANGSRDQVKGIGLITSDYISPDNSENPHLDKDHQHLRKVDWLVLEDINLKKYFFNRDTLNELNILNWNEILITYFKNKDFNLLQKLFSEFENEYLSKEIGISHLKSYEQESLLVKGYFNEIKEDPSIVDNIVDPKLNYIVPIKRNSVSTVGFKSFKAFGFSDEQMPELTWAFVNLVNELIDSNNKNEEKNIINKFKSSKFGKGFQNGVISPILHDLDSDFLIINSKTIDTVNFLSKIIDVPINLNVDILKYIDNNEKLKEFVMELEEYVPEFANFNIFDAFCHWLCDKTLAGYAKSNPLPLYSINQKDAYKSFSDYLSNKGFYFEPETIENFLLSLKAKPFVIFTGNSGTGKTKIAQLFAQYVSNSMIKKSSINTQVMVGKAAKNKGWTLKRDVLNDFGIPNINGSYDIKVDGIKGRANFSLLSQLFYERNSSIKSRLSEIESNDPNQIIDLEIILPTNDYSQYKIVPVGANWTENRHIIGFYNVITDEYITSDALELILEASKPENLDKPFFLILDEMNLSHVERYFADFLSAMESGEYISLHKSHGKTNYPNEIKMPKNLFVIGTVNVDETTYMFSPKVLDRANVIEFSTISAKDYMLNGLKQKKLNGNVDYLENPLYKHNTAKSLCESRIDNFELYLRNVKTSNGTKLWDLLSEQLNRFQSVLKTAGFDFGFRVIDEILRFMYVAWYYEGEKEIWDNWKRYFDAQIKQKMLPRIHGSQRMLESTLNDLSELCLDYPTSKAKLEEMKNVLYKQRYVSFTN